MIRKEGKYQPIIRKDKLGFKGIFNSTETLINELIKRFD